jgi:CRISPR-associated protein Csb2
MARLAIQCRLLLGSYQASDPFGELDTPEWPPHPFRLHAALVGAACERGGEEPSGGDVEALLWLERQGLPSIRCSGSICVRSAPDVFVPRNPVKAEFDRSRAAWGKRGEFVDPWQRNARRFPTAVPQSPTVVFEWPAVKAVPAVLEGIVAGVSWLGSSRSPIACALLGDESPVEPATFVPVAARGTSLRVAAPGITDGLLATRHEWPTAVDPPLASYDGSGDGKAVEAEPRFGPLGELLVRTIENPIHEIGDAALLTQGLRRAVLSVAGDDAPAVLHGHGPDHEHGAYLALADVGHRYASGLIRGLAVALPRGASAADRLRCVEALEALTKVSLGEGLRPLSLRPPSADLATLRPERWTRPAYTFATATPIILDRFPRRKRTAEDELRASLETAGFPGAEEVEVLAGPAVRAAAPTGRLRGDLPPGLRVHARIKFSEPVVGPLIAGRGRFRGIGLALPIAEGRDGDGA